MVSRTLLPHGAGANKAEAQLRARGLHQSHRLLASLSSKDRLLNNNKSYKPAGPETTLSRNRLSLGGGIVGATSSGRIPRGRRPSSSIALPLASASLAAPTAAALTTSTSLAAPTATLTRATTTRAGAGHGHGASNHAAAHVSAGSHKLQTQAREQGREEYLRRLVLPTFPACLARRKTKVAARNP